MCLEKKGFNDLFEEIYNIFKDNMVETNILNILENGTNYEVNLNNFDLKEFIKKKYFFEGNYVRRYCKSTNERFRFINRNFSFKFNRAI